MCQKLGTRANISVQLFLIFRRRRNSTDLSTTDTAVSTRKKKKGSSKLAEQIVWRYTCWIHSFNGFRKIEGANPTSISETICIHNTVLVCSLFIWHYLYASFFSICICFPDCFPGECQTSKKHTLAVHLHNVMRTLPFVNASCTRQESQSIPCQPLSTFEQILNCVL